MFFFFFLKMQCQINVALLRANYFCNLSMFDIFNRSFPVSFIFTYPKFLVCCSTFVCSSSFDIQCRHQRPQGTKILTEKTTSIISWENIQRLFRFFNFVNNDHLFCYFFDKSTPLQEFFLLYTFFFRKTICGMRFECLLRNQIPIILEKVGNLTVGEMQTLRADRRF